ncbi:hypothetical protein ACFU8I_31605 [Streptomyces sp. NPDC057540]|uniref:hypothetical protein n=1 Tax=Streptomyces sp. NPDC057540 TaxID=3346160 RepID=UPI00369E4607
MSDHQLPATTLSGAFAVTAAAAWAAAGRRRGAPAIAGAMVALQGALHLLFATAGHPVPGTHGTHAMTGTDAMRTMHGTHAMTGTDAMHAMHGTHAMPGTDAMHAMHGTHAMTGTDAMHAMHGMHALDGADAMDGMVMATADPMGTTSGAGMVAVHLLAALLCGLWLAHGEAALFTLARAALAHAFTPLRLLLALAPVPEAPRRPVRRTRRTAPRPHTVVLAHALSRRGPPRLSVPRATALGAHV